MTRLLAELTPDVHAFWMRFVAHLGRDPAEHFCESFHFGDSEGLADELADLTLSGKKRATAGSLWTYELKRQPLVRPGDLSIVTRWSGAPVCIIETKSVEIVPYDQVSAEFAAIEGEGDGSLTFWQWAHSAYFERECARLGRVFGPQMPVLCETFEVVFPQPL